MRGRTLFALALALVMVSGTAMAAKKSISETRDVKPVHAAKAGLRYARILNSRGHPEAANVMCHLAFQETQAMRCDRTEEHIKRVDIQMKIIQVAIDLDRKDTAMHLITACETDIKKIGKPNLINKKTNELVVLRKKAKALK